MRRPWLLWMSVALTFATPVSAQEWLTIETDRFSVVSELSERDTRGWAREFDRFVNALQGLIPANESLLPSLTAVLFRRSGSFAPYRMRTESGVVRGNAGIFVSYPTWSLLAMPGVRSSTTDDATIFHEAVHWYMSADPTRYPLWFREGIAEVFSTFDTERGMAQWGRPIRRHLEYLRDYGFQPMREFLAVTQDEAMHTNAAYYPQAWLLVHYLLFSQLGEGTEQLSPLLRNSKDMTPIGAFNATFDFELEEMDRMLRDYARGRMNIATTPINEAAASDLVARPAPEALVALSLARLAFASGNDEAMQSHLDRLIETAPESAEAYDLMAAIRLREGGDDIEALLDAAIDRGSRDARTYELKALARASAVRRNQPLFSPTAFDPADARQIANYLVSAANLRPINPSVYTTLADALFSVDETLEYDRIAFENGRAVYPDSGIMLVGLAALALDENDRSQALNLLGAALEAPYEMDAGEARAASALLERLRGR